MTETLYINEQVVDMDGATNIVINVQNAYFSDVSKLNAANTNTIRLPKTKRNRDIFQDADLIQTRSRFPYEYQNVSFYRDGVEVVRDGSLYLLSTSNTHFECTIIFGVDAVFKLLKETSDTLQDLNDTSTIIYDPRSIAAVPEWNGYPPANFFYIYGDFSCPLESESEHAVEVQRGWLSKGVLPAVHVVWILSLIQLKYGFNLVFGAEFSFIYRLAIPLLTHDADANTSLSDAITIEGGADKAIVSLRTHNIFSPASTAQKLKVSSTKTISLRMNIDKTMTAGDAQICRVGMVVVVRKESDNSEVSSENVDFLITKNTDGSYQVYCNQTVEVTISGSEYLTFESKFPSYVIFFNLLAGQTITATNAGEKVPVGSRMPVVRNLPKIKILDFIRSLLVVSGTYLYDDLTTAVAYNDVLENISRAKDWSDKLIPVSSENIPANIEYKVGDYARRNVLAWKKADDVEEGRYDGSLNVSNETLDEEKTLFTMPFAACNTNDGKANIPVFKLANYNELYSGEETTPSYDTETTEARLIYCDGVYNELWDMLLTGATFPSHMHFQNVIAEKYAVLSGLLNNAVVIKEEFRLSDYDIANISMDVPIYLRQYGAYFVIYKLRQKDNNTSEVTLVKISTRR